MDFVLCFVFLERLHGTYNRPTTHKPDWHKERGELFSSQNKIPAKSLAFEKKKENTSGLGENRK